MRLTVVGCAGSFPSAASPASCYLLEHDDHRIVLDMGNGSMVELQRHIDLMGVDALDAVVLSHCHIDHCADVGALYVQRRYQPGGGFPQLPLLGPAEAGRRLADIYGMDSPDSLRDVFDLRPFSRQPMEVGPFTIEVARASHPVEAYSVRVGAGGRSVTYSGDTGPTPALGELARGTDVALFEATFTGQGNPVDLHLTGAQAGRAAREAGAAMLLLTHLTGWTDESAALSEAAGEFDGPIEVARTGMVVTT